MGVLKNLTDEYFGNVVRGEDEVFRHEIDPDNPPKHTLTQKELTFLRGLARYMLFLDKSLFFQIVDLQRHTRLVFSGKQVQSEDIYDNMGWEHNLQCLEATIEENEKEAEQGEPTSDEVSLLSLLREQRQRMKDALGGPARKEKPGVHLGEFVHIRRK